MWLHWKYRKGDTDDLSKGTWLFNSHFYSCFHNTIWCMFWKIQSIAWRLVPVQSIHQWAHEAALHIEDLAATFVTIALILIFLLILSFIARVIYLLCLERLDKADNFSFFTFWLEDFICSNFLILFNFISKLILLLESLVIMRIKKVFDLNFNFMSFFFLNLNVSALLGLRLYMKLYSSALNNGKYSK